MTQYSVLRSVSHSNLHLIHIDGEFDELPQEVRQSGPWQGVRRGPLEKLNLKYRHTVAKQGYWMGECRVQNLKLE